MNYRSPSARLFPRLLWLLTAAPIACAPAGSEPPGNGSGGRGNVATGGTTNSTGGASPNEGSGGAVAPGTTGGVTGSTGGASETGGSVGSGGAGMGGTSGGTGGAGGGGLPPAGMVPMFVATGYSARTITSCDDGKTWIGDHQYNPTVTGGKDECGTTPCNRSHQDLTEKGLAYGNGMFVQIVGWGANPSVNVSRNGVDWKLTHIPSSLIRIDGNILFLTEPTPHFVALTGYRGACAESPDAENWKACPAAPMYSSSLREAGGGGPAIGGSGDTPMVFSFDSAKTWATNSNCAFGSEFGNLGQEGGIMWGKDSLVVVNTGGSFCRTKDLGKTWQTGKIGGGAVGKASFSGGKFWAPNGAYAHTSDDGVTWTRIDFKPAGVRIHEMAVGDSGTVVGVERLGDTGSVSREPARFYRSVDGGQNWTMSTAAAGTMFRRVVFGYGQPSAKCPMPQ